MNSAATKQGEAGFDSDTVLWTQPIYALQHGNRAATAVPANVFFQWILPAMRTILWRRCDAQSWVALP